MHSTIPALAITALSLGLFSCTSEPVPSAQRAGPGIVTTYRHDTKESELSPIESTTSRIPLIDRETLPKFETATFALG